MPEKDYIWGSGLPAKQGDALPSSASANQIIKFELTLPDSTILSKPQIKSLWDAYGHTGGGTGTSFILYALVQELSESSEQTVLVRRSKGGYVENHWGPKPSIITASGQVGLHLSAFGITPFQTESKNAETVLTWDPTTKTLFTKNDIEIKTDSENYLNAKTQGLMNLAVNKIGEASGGALGTLLSNAQYTSNTRTNTDDRVHKTLDAATINSAAEVGTNAAFRKFRMLLDLFKHNGLVLDNLPNMSIHPSVYTAENAYTSAGGVQHGKAIQDLETLQKMRKFSQIAPGNILASLPIQMYVKDSIFHGFFQNFNFSYSEDNPFIANYDFTFISRHTTRTAVFFPSGTAGKKPYSLVLNSSFPKKAKF